MTYHFARPKEAMRHIICCTEIGRSAEAQFIYLSSPSIITDYDYDDALRLKTLTHHFNPDYLGNSGTRIYSYTRDAAGWVIDFKIDGVSDNYSHDDNGQVLSGSGGSYSY